MENGIPQHIAIIMDGNGRWAEKRFLNKAAGHKAGAEALRKLEKKVEKLGIKYLTVYAFSTENWTRDADEVAGLMNLLRSYIKRYIDDADKNNLRLKVIGDITRLDRDLQDNINLLIEKTKNKTGLTMVMALNYGGRDEFTRVGKELCKLAAGGGIKPSDVTESYISSLMDTNDIPDPELLIRTSGEMRLSNFMLWQLAYTEFYFTDKLWPDFTINDLQDAIKEYQGRSRRFGGR